VVNFSGGHVQYEVKRLDLTSVFKIAFVIHAVLGFVGGLFSTMVLMRLAGTLGSLMEGTGYMPEMQPVGFFGSFFGALFFALFAGVFGAAITVVAAAVYNLVAGSLGGVKMELATPPPGYSPAPAPAYPPPRPEPPPSP